MPTSLTRFITSLAGFFGLAGKELPYVPTIDPARTAELARSGLESYRTRFESSKNEQAAVSVTATRPVRMTKKRIAEKHLLEPGWDRPTERDEVLKWLPKYPQWFDRYCLLFDAPLRSNITRANYEKFARWSTFTARTILPTARRRFGKELIGFSADVFSQICETYFRQKMQADLERKTKQGLIYTDDIDPYEYEKFCGRILKNAGWNTEVTKSSGDQGVDVIASKFGIKVALQVKKYSSPVGNDAVQQIFAGKQFYKADYAAVVCTAGFTRSAYELARSAGVHLLHHNELQDLERLLRSRGK